YTDILLDVGERRRGGVLRLLGPRRDAVEQSFEAFVHVGQITSFASSRKARKTPSLYCAACSSAQPVIARPIGAEAIQSSSQPWIASSRSLSSGRRLRPDPAHADVVQAASRAISSAAPRCALWPRPRNCNWGSARDG